MYKEKELPIMHLGLKSEENRIVRFPIEIHEEIIGFFLDNWFHAGTIATHCAPVCRAWLPYSRRKLYSSIDFEYCRQ